jgi:hypothetical protein
MSLEQTEEKKFIKVNVGGMIFALSSAAVTTCSYFNAMVNFHSAKDENFSDTIIDRDHQTFSYILNCIRDLNYINTTRLTEIKPDLLFFGCNSLLELIESDTKECKKILVKKVSPHACFHINEDEKWMRISPTPYDSESYSHSLRMWPGSKYSLSLGIELTVPIGFCGIVTMGKCPGYIILQPCMFTGGFHKFPTVCISITGSMDRWINFNEKELEFHIQILPIDHAVTFELIK